MRAGPAVKTTTRRAEEHRLGDAVGDEQDRLARLLPDAQQLEVHLLPRQRVEGAERLVHQHQLRVVDQRAGDRRALLHAARQLVGALVLGARQADQRQQVARPLAARLLRQAEDLGRQQHVVDDRPPLQQQRLLEHHADVARRIERMLGRADRHRAAVVRMQAGQDLQQRALAAARRARPATGQLARHDVEGGVGDREVRLRARAVGLGDVGEVDERLGGRGGLHQDTRASGTTSARSSSSTAPYSSMPISVISSTAMNIAAVSSVTCTCSMR